jgi:hypothetical protein
MPFNVFGMHTTLKMPAYASTSTRFCNSAIKEGKYYQSQFLENFGSKSLAVVLVDKRSFRGSLKEAVSLGSPFSIILSTSLGNLIPNDQPCLSHRKASRANSASIERSLLNSAPLLSRNIFAPPELPIIRPALRFILIRGNSLNFLSYNREHHSPMINSQHHTQTNLTRKIQLPMANSQPLHVSRYTLKPVKTFHDLLPFQALNAIDSDLIHMPRDSKPGLIMKPEDIDRDFEHFSPSHPLVPILLQTLFNLPIPSSISLRISRTWFFASQPTRRKHRLRDLEREDAQSISGLRH